MLTTAVARVTVPTTRVTFLVPGHEVWAPRSVIGVASRSAGGAPDRGYELTISYTVATVAAVGAADVGGEPGICTITWADTASSAVGQGGQGISVAPIPKLALPPGYVITLDIVNAVAGDTWTSAAVWYDFAYSDT